MGNHITAFRRQSRSEGNESEIQPLRHFELEGSWQEYSYPKAVTTELERSWTILEFECVAGSTLGCVAEVVQHSASGFTLCSNVLDLATDTSVGDANSDTSSTTDLEATVSVGSDHRTLAQLENLMQSGHGSAQSMEDDVTTAQLESETKHKSAKEDENHASGEESTAIQTDEPPLSDTFVHQPMKRKCQEVVHTGLGDEVVPKRSRFTEDTESEHESIGRRNRSYSTSLTSPREKKRIAIADVLQRNFVPLIDQINPEEASCGLYAIAVITLNDFEKATNKHVSRKDRATELALVIIRRLRASPESFDDVCVILKKAGVTVIEDVKAEVLKQCPEESAVKSFAKPLFTVGSSNTISPATTKDNTAHMLLTSVERYYKDEGVKGLKEFVESETEKHPGVLLLHEACKGDVDVQVLNILLAESDHGDINSKDKDGRTPLHVACAALVGPSMLQQRMKVENLLKNGASGTIQDNDGNTALHLSSIRKDAPTVRLLLRYSPQCINTTNKRGNTALHIACGEGVEDIVQELCDRKANPAIPNKKKEQTPMHLACKCNRVPSANKLAIYDRSTADGIDKKRQTPLHITCKRCNATLTEELLNRTKCDPYKLDEQHKTPLHYACFWGNQELVSPLLKCEHRRGFVNAQDIHGDTALHIASRCGHKHIIKLLLDNKANKNIKNYDGCIAAQVAVDSDKNKAAEILLRKRHWLKQSGKKAVKKMKRSPSSTSSLSNHSSMSSLSSTLSSQPFSLISSWMSSEESGCDETIDNKQ